MSEGARFWDCILGKRCQPANWCHLSSTLLNRLVMYVGILRFLNACLLCRPRETARSLPDHDYVFDLDGDENDEDHQLHHPLFSVDSKSCGESSARICEILLSCFRELDTFHQVSYVSMWPFLLLNSKQSFLFSQPSNLPSRTRRTTSKWLAVHCICCDGRHPSEDRVHIWLWPSCSRANHGDTEGQKEDSSSERSKNLCLWDWGLSGYPLIILTHYSFFPQL